MSERGIDNDMLALLEWVRNELCKIKWMQGQISDAEYFQRFKNRDK